MTNKPKCLHCGHVMTGDEMYESDIDLFDIAPSEEVADIECPKCEKMYICQGGYLPTYQRTANPEGFIKDK